MIIEEGMNMSKSNEKLFRSTLFLSSASLITQFLGMIYIIPFYSIMGGEENLALYGYAYTPYTIMLSIASAGVPGAVSKFVAKYNSLGAYQTTQKLYRSSLVVMLISGLFSFGVLYFLAPVIADIQLAASSTGTHVWGHAEITNIIRIVAFAVIVVPFMSTWRGVFQGFESFGPTSVSSVVEQVVRITVVLSGSYFVIRVMGGTIQQGNQIAVFAAFIAALGAIFTLGVFWFKRKKLIEKDIENDTTGITLSYREMYKEIILSGIPFVVIGITFPMMMFIDQLTHNNALSMIGVPSNIQDAWFGILNITTQKLVMIPVSLAVAFSITILPFITKSFQQKKFDELENQVSSMVLLQLILVVPAAIGMMIMAVPLYTSFYSFNEMGIKILTFYAPVCIVISLFSMTASIVQGIEKQNFNVFVVLLVLIIKAVLNIPLIMYFHTVGAVMSTIIALSCGVIFNFYIIKKYGRFSVRKILTPLMQILAYSLIMLLAVEIIYGLFALSLDLTVRLNSIITLAVCVIVGASIYMIIVFKSGLADRVLGDRAEKIRSRVRFL